MITYTVKYKHPLQWFYRTIRKVKGDGILETSSHRFFILENESRIEIPLGYLFKFSEERFLLIQTRMNSEAGQVIPLDKK